MGSDGVYFFEKGRKGKKDKFISHTDFGKVIIAKDCPGEGFYSLVNAEERLKCIITDVEKEVYDYYYGISYEEFKSLLEKRGYKLAFEMPFTYLCENEKRDEKRSSDEIRIVAYKPELNMVIVADTINNKHNFYSVKCYCYGVDGNKLVGSLMFVLGSHDCVVFKLNNSRYRIYRPLHEVEKCCRKGYLEGVYSEDVPAGFTYADNPVTEEDFARYTEDFLNRCPEELRSWFVRG